MEKMRNRWPVIICPLAHLLLNLNRDCPRKM